MKPAGLTILIILSATLLMAQENSGTSVHREQNAYYASFGDRDRAFYDSLNAFAGTAGHRSWPGCQLQRTVFGYHPYWGGSAYLNYQWDLLSDFCYFSYEVDPSTGNPVTLHDWLTDPAIDSAFANGVRVHLCVTLFSGHLAFFTNPAARATLTGNLIALLAQRGGNGINIDFEAVPGYLGDSLASFIHDLSVQLKSVQPDALLSIATPAVNWGNAFDLQRLDEDIDLFMVMGYDYYVNGSSQAGPVAPLYSLTAGYDQSLSRTITAYVRAGISPEKFILGLPYYGRQWKTESNSIPSSILATGAVLTYTNVRNNGSGAYIPENYIWEPNSLSSCYIFFQNSNWFQCFIALDRDLRKRYDIVNYFNLAGIGIWALGYDNGYPDLWQAISDKFTDCTIPLVFDTLYDNGGPAWNHYPDEDYTMTIDHGWNDERWLHFNEFSLEAGFDSLWIYAGPDTLAPLLGGFSGDTSPGTVSSPSGVFTLRFKSDFVNTRAGWNAVFHDGSLGTEGSHASKISSVTIFPNPVSGILNISLDGGHGFTSMSVYDEKGAMVFHKNLNSLSGDKTLKIDVSTLPAGNYPVLLLNTKGLVFSFILIKI